MSSIFTAPALTPQASLPPRPATEVERIPPAQSRDIAAGQAYGAAPQGAGGPAVTGAVAEPTALIPAPAPPPVVSTSQTGRVTAQAILARDSDTAPVAAPPRAPAGDSGPPVAAPASDRDVPPPETGARAGAGASQDVAALYRAAHETTAAAEPARLLMDA